MHYAIRYHSLSNYIVPSTVLCTLNLLAYLIFVSIGPAKRNNHVILIEFNLMVDLLNRELKN